MSDTSLTEDILAVFEHYRTYHPQAHRNPQRGSAEWVKIAARLKEGFTAQELRWAVDGNHVSPWHRGENPQGKAYHKLGLIVRSGSHVTDFIEIYQSTPGPVVSEKTARGLRAGEAWIAMDMDTDESQKR